MQAGKLRNYIEIKQPPLTETFNENGELITTPVHFAYAWAAIEPLTGREFYAARQINATVTGKIRIRYISGVKATMKVLFNNRYFDINAIMNPDEKNEELILLVTEVV